MRRARLVLFFLTALLCTGLAPPASAAPEVPSADTAAPDLEADLAILFVRMLGDGNGLVDSTPTGIKDCGSDPFGCYAEFEVGTVVTLTAQAGELSVFEGWSGPCTGTEPCVLTLEAGRTEVGATFEAPVLGVFARGDGMGVITSDPAGIKCGDMDYDCHETYPPGTQVTLTAEPIDDVSAFVGWVGACSGTGPCVVTMDEDVVVGADFDMSRLWVEPQGEGAGIVTSDPAGIRCSYDDYPCTMDYLPGTKLTLIAKAGKGSTFTGWGGACSGTGLCELTMDQDTVVEARFERALTYALKVEKTGLGEGTVESAPSGISCGPDCREAFVAGSKVMLTAKAAPGSVFVGWSVVCSSTPACQVTVDQAKTIKAQFDLVATPTGVAASTAVVRPGLQ